MSTKLAEIASYSAIGAIDDLADAMDVVRPNHPLRCEVDSIDRRLTWAELSTSERILLRHIWERAHRTPCPLPIRP
jgi:hypothetical protein